MLSGLTLAAVTSAFDASDAMRISLFGAGACFFAALLATEVRSSDRVRTFGWASVVSAVAIVVTAELSRSAVWAAAAFLVLQMFMSYALRPWSLRAGTLAVIGALITFLVGAMRISIDQIGWFVLASTVGFAWIAGSECLLHQRNSVRSLERSVDVFRRSAGAAVAGVLHVLTTTNDGDAPHRVEKALGRGLGRVTRCRSAIESQLSGALSPDFGPPDVEQLRVALYCAERGIEEVINNASDRQWLDRLPDDIASSLTRVLTTLTNAMMVDVDVDAQQLDAVGRDAQLLRERIHEATTIAPGTALAALTTVLGVQLLAQSVSQATVLASAPSIPACAAERTRATAAAQSSVETTRVTRTLSPTMAMAIQAAVAAVLAGLVAKLLGNEQSLLVAWTAYVIIAGSAEASTRRAWLWLAATIFGATAGVAVAASVPDNIVWTVVVVTIGVFFTIVTATGSYPAMVFWMSIALVPLYATEGRYLDLIWDKAVAALIGGCVAGAVALTLAPIRLSRDVRPALLEYLDALDAALEAQLPGGSGRRAMAGFALDRAHSALDSMISSAVIKTHLFPRQGGPLTEQGVRIDAVHEAFLRLTPLLTDSSRRLHGWMDQQVALSIGLLRDAVEAAKSATRGDSAAIATFTTSGLWFTDDLHTRLRELAQVGRIM